MSATADEVLEAMGGAIHDAEPGAFRPWAEIIKAEADGDKLAILVARSARTKARAAIRALPPGWAVAKVPEERFLPDADDEEQAYEDGYNAALAAIRLGVSTRKVAPFTQTILVIFLVAISLTTRELHPEQLAWLIFIPLAALVFHEPRVEDVGTRRNGLRTGILVALGAGAFIVEAHVLGFTLDGVEEPNSWRAFIDFALLIGAVVGLLSLYDLSARETLAELQRLRQLLSMCAWCKKINSSDSWMTADQYLAKAHPRQLSHGICPTCAERHFSE